MTPLEAAWESARDRLHGLGFDEFCESVAGWRVVPVVARGETVGALLINGPEIHACVLPVAHKRWVSRALLAELDAVIQEHGYAVTRVDESREQGKHFVRRLGFMPILKDGNTVIYGKVNNGH